MTLPERSPDCDNYLAGFGNHFISEAEKGAVPYGQNSPQKAPLGLYAEQLSGSSFVMPRHENYRSWLYRIRPSVLHSPFVRIANQSIRSRPFNEIEASPNQMRWDAFSLPEMYEKVDFIDGIKTIAGNGDSASLRGSAIHVYCANSDMSDRFFYNSDGDFLVVPEKGRLKFATEFGIIGLAPGEIIVVPRGIKFQVSLPDKSARGYILENYGPPFKLPGLGPIGSNGLANSRDFLAPKAAYEDQSSGEQSFKLTNKFNGQLWQAEISNSPLDVVGWHGNYYPYKYDLALFNVINTVSFDHPDPSIFTVLTSPSELPGTANVDFVIFPPRWMVAEHTFRPPYYHRNIMSEYMGLIFGVYDAKEEGFVPGGGSLHNTFTAHGPDQGTFNKASQDDLKPIYQGNTMAFMFESSLVYAPTKLAMETTHLQKNYQNCWQGLSSNFSLDKS
jgi:homogentisate 1,2-dioxygenase